MRIPWRAGIRYASAPVKRLRFMPPTPYNYAANQLHDSTKFGPICMQRWPVDLSPQTKNHSWSSYSSTSTATATATASAAKTTATSSSEEPVAESVADELLAKTMPSTAFHYLRPLFRRLIAREQSEDCLNLNIYVPLSGKFGRVVVGQQTRQDQFIATGECCPVGSVGNSEPTLVAVSPTSDLLRSNLRLVYPSIPAESGAAWL